MFSGILMVILGGFLIAYAIYQFVSHKRQQAIIYSILALISLGGGIILILLSKGVLGA